MLLKNYCKDVDIIEILQIFLFACVIFLFYSCLQYAKYKVMIIKMKVISFFSIMQK